MREIQRCTRCIMDNSADQYIKFDEKGVCNYCTEAYSKMKSNYFPNQEGEIKLNELVEKLKRENKEKLYDCIMGVSGGLDSSYLLYLGHKLGLRVLAIHVDDGFDTEISKSNLLKLSKATNFKIINVKPDLEEYYEVIKAYMRAGVPNLAVMQDNITLRILFDYAKKTKISTFLSGANFSLESILQRGNTYTTSDIVNIKAINKKFGTIKLKKLKFISGFRRALYQKIYKVEYLRPLNYIDYNKDKAMKELYEFCGFSYYGSKHHENLFTKFLQNYWFVNKFGVDKRTSHLSSLIVSGQLSREQALKELEKPLYEEPILTQDLSTVLQTLEMSSEEFDIIMKQKPMQHTDYKTSLMVRFWHFIRGTYKK